MGLHHVHVCTLIFTLVSQLWAHVECENENNFALVASQGLVHSWAREWVFIWSNKTFSCLDFWPLEHQGVFHEDQREKEDSWNFYSQLDKCKFLPWCITSMCLYHIYMSTTTMCIHTNVFIHTNISIPHQCVYPVPMCLPHTNVSTPYQCVYPTPMRLSHIYEYTAYLFVYPTSVCLSHIRMSTHIYMSTPHLWVYPTSMSLSHIYESTSYLWVYRISISLPHIYQSTPSSTSIAHIYEFTPHLWV